MNIDTALKNAVFELKKNNIDVLLDDTDEHLSAKFKKFDLIGVPYQILLGKKSDGDLLEFREIGKDPQNLSIEQITKFLTEQKEKTKTNLTSS